MKQSHTDEDIEKVKEKAIQQGHEPLVINGVERSVVAVSGKVNDDHRAVMKLLPNVSRVIPVGKPYKLASKNYKKKNSIIQIENLTIGGDKIAIIAGPDSAETQEQTLASEYILSRGNENVMLCERGIRTYETATRNTFDINAIPFLKQNSHLPVIADPSHATGDNTLVEPVALAAIAAGADGLLIEIHPRPEEALCDGPQALLPSELETLISKASIVAKAVGRSL